MNLPAGRHRPVHATRQARARTPRRRRAAVPVYCRTSRRRPQSRRRAQNCADQKSGRSPEKSRRHAPRLRRALRDPRTLRAPRRFTARDDALVARKLAMAIEAGLTPVLCIGEDLRVRDAGRRRGASVRIRSAPRPCRSSRSGRKSSSPTSRSGRSERDATPAARCARRPSPRSAHALERFWPDGCDDADALRRQRHAG